MRTISMQTKAVAAPSRRTFLAGAGATALLAGLGTAIPSGARAAPREFRLRAAPGTARPVPAPYPDTAVWSYGCDPGPETRVRQGEGVRILVVNALAESSTVHWHGMRVPHAMDGAPHLPQQPIAPGESVEVGRAHV